MDFVFAFPADPHKNTGILVFADRLSKMEHLVAVPETINASTCSRVFIDTVFRFHGLPRELVSDWDPRFSIKFWHCVFKTLESRLKISTSDHLKQMIRPNAPIVSSRRSFKDTSIPLRIGENSSRWWSLPSTIQSMRRRRTRRTS